MNSFTNPMELTLQSELRSGESLVWSGAPDPARLSRKAVPLFIFGIFWTGFALFWIAGASGMFSHGHSGGFRFFALFGLPFVLVGCGLLASPFVLRSVALNTVYAVTNQRALIISKIPFKGVQIRSFLPSALGSIEKVLLDNGRGDIIFERMLSVGNTRHPNLTVVGFMGIAEVQKVEELLLALAQGRS